MDGLPEKVQTFWAVLFLGVFMKGLYIHIPFCRKKCAYCDFVSYVGCEDFFDRYISAAEKEMSRYKGEKIDTVFVGGGTPSILADSQLERRFGAI